MIGIQLDAEVDRCNSERSSADKKSDIRADINARLPRFLQPWFTYLTGKRPLGEPPRQQAVSSRIAQPCVALAIGILLSAWAIDNFEPFVLPVVLFISWTIAVGAARDLQLTIYHHAAHGTVFNKAWSERIGRLIGSILFIEPFDSYAPKHRREHHGRHTVCTEVDPTLTFLIDTIGIKPGVSEGENFRTFVRSIFSSVVHTRMLVERIKRQFTGWHNIVGVIAAQVCIAVALISTTGVAGYVVGFVIPMTIGYQAAQIARLVVEHRWPEKSPHGGKRSAEEHAFLTVSVRCAVPPPPVWTLSNTLKFLLHTLFNAWIRWTVLPGDSGPSHHWHHGEASGDWVNHIDAAARWEKRQGAKEIEYSEAWGYGSALAMALESFKSASVESIRPPSRGDRNV